VSAELAHVQREQVRELQRTNLRRLWAQKSPEVRAATRASLIAGLHDAQRKVVAALSRGERYVALCCGRRGGKTHLVATLIHLILLDAQRGQDVVFVAPTLKRGKELIWGELERLHELYCFGYQLRAHQGTMHTHTGAAFRIVGLDNQRQVGKIARGGNTRAFLADEVQEFSHLLEPLIEAASPALAQTRGAFIASGTPGYVRRGYWHELCHGGAGFVNVTWTLFDNPFLGRDPHEIVAEEKASKGWSDTHPTLLREYYAKWVDDQARRVCELSDDNIVDQVPEYDAATWRHFIGVDYGNSPDPTAWVVLAAHPHRNLVACVHSESQLRLTSDQICERTNALREQYAAKRIVGDSASGGKTFIQDFNTRYALRAGFSMSPAEKHDKRGSIDMLNTELRTGRLLLLRQGAAGLIAEMQALMWDEDHEAFLPGLDHEYDAARYSWRALRSYLARPAAVQKTAEQKELERIIQRNRQNAAGGFSGAKGW
jgi:hypothetical protein